MNAFGGRGMCSTLSRRGPRRRGRVGGGMGRSRASVLADASMFSGLVSASGSRSPAGGWEGEEEEEEGDKGEGGVFSSVRSEG